MKTNIISKRLITVIVLLVSAAFVFTGCNDKTDVTAYVSLSFSGYDGNGEAQMIVDYDAMIASIIGEEPDDDSSEAFGKWMTKYMLYEDGISFTYSPTKGLSNGDIVTVSVSLSDNAAKSVTGEAVEFTVSNLPEVETVDIFKDISLRYEGMIGDYTTVHLDKLSDSQLIQDCSFKIEPEINVRNGDTVTVTITNVDALAEDHLSVPAETCKTFTVSGLDAYLTDPTLLPMEMVQDIVAEYVAASRKEDNFIFTYGDPIYYQTFFCIGKEDAIDADFNRLLVYICYDEFMDGNYRHTVYTPLVFRNLVLRADGTVSLEYEDGENAVFQTSPESVQEYMEESYLVEEISIGN